MSDENKKKPGNIFDGLDKPKKPSYPGNVKSLGKYAIHGGPGRPVGYRGGPEKLWLEICRCAAKAKNLKRFRDELQAKFEENPLGWYKAFVEPFIPRKIEFSGDPLTQNLSMMQVNIDGKESFNPDEEKKLIDDCITDQLLFP